jgi:hypothetical protein
MGFFTSLRVIFSSDSSKKSSSRSEYEKDHHNSRRRSHKKKSRNQQSELNASEISVTSDPAHTTSTSETHSFHYIDGRKFADESTISYVLPYDEDGTSIFNLGSLASKY